MCTLCFSMHCYAVVMLYPSHMLRICIISFRLVYAMIMHILCVSMWCYVPSIQSYAACMHRSHFAPHSLFVHFIYTFMHVYATLLLCILLDLRNYVVGELCGDELMQAASEMQCYASHIICVHPLRQRYVACYLCGNLLMYSAETYARLCGR